MPDSLRTRLADTIYPIIAGRPAALATVSAQVDDSGGWQSYTGGPHDRDAGATVQSVFQSMQASSKG